MVHYRVYALHPTTGSIVAGDDLSADNDAEAIAKGLVLHAGKRFELWCGTRRVHVADGSALSEE